MKTLLLALLSVPAVAHAENPYEYLRQRFEAAVPLNVKQWDGWFRGTCFNPEGDSLPVFLVATQHRIAVISDEPGYTFAQQKDFHTRFILPYLSDAQQEAGSRVSYLKSDIYDGLVAARTADAYLYVYQDVSTPRTDGYASSYCFATLTQGAPPQRPAYAPSMRDAPAASGDAVGVQPMPGALLTAPEQRDGYASPVTPGMPPAMVIEREKQRQAMDQDVRRQIDGTTLTSGNGAAKLATQIQRIQGNATVLADAIDNVAGLVGPTGNGSMTDNAALYNKLTDANNGSGVGGTGKSGLLAKINASQPASLMAGLDDLAATLDGAFSGSLTGEVGAAGNLSDKLQGQIATIGTAVLTGSGAGFDFVSYSGRASQVFSDGDVSSVMNIVGLNIGGYNYSVAISSSDIHNGDTLTFQSSSGRNEALVLVFRGADITNGDGNSNAAELYPMLASFFQAGTRLTPAHFSARIATAQQLIDGGVTGDLTAGLGNLRSSIDGSSGFTIAGTTGSDFVVPAYTGTTSQVFGAGAFSNGGSPTINVTIGVDTYTYEADGPISGYGTIKFVSGSNILIIQHNTGTPIPGSSAQEVADNIVAALNTYFASGSRIAPGNLAAKVGNLATMIGGSDPDLATKIGDPGTFTSGLANLVNATQATNNNNVWTDDAVGFKGATTLNDQLSQFLAMFSRNNLQNAPSGQVTFQLSYVAPASLGALIGMAVSTQ